MVLQLNKSSVKKCVCKQIAKLYLNELKDQEDDFHRFFNEDLIHS